MRTVAVAFLGVLCVITTVHAQGNCHARVGGIPAFDAWCNATCNRTPAFCPARFCSCGATTNIVCHSEGPLAAFIPDSVCQNLCSGIPDYCPPQLCRCYDTTDIPVIAPVAQHEPGCCAGDPRFLFFSAQNVVYKWTVGSTDEPAVCYTFTGGNPSDIALDDDGNIYIAVPGLSKVFRGSVDCIPNTLEEITSFLTSPVSNPTGLVIADGRLYISSHDRIFRVSFDANGDVFQVETLNITLRFAHDIEVGEDGSIYFIESDGSIRRLDSNGVVTTVLAVHQHNIPDLRGITVNSCGLFLVATDSNRVYFCPDPTDGSTCRLYCDESGTDALSCTFLRDPTKITTGCCCDVYVTNPGNGNIVYYPNDGTGTGPVAGQLLFSEFYHATAIKLYSPQSVPGCQSVCDPSPHPTPSPTSSPSSSPSNTPSPSASPSTTPSPQPSPSQTASPSVAITGRLIPGINLSAPGGATQASVLTGYATLTLVKCPPGAAPTIAECPQGVDDYKIPVSKVSLHSRLGTTFARIAPFVTAVSSPVGGRPAEPVCLWHVTGIHNNAGVLQECDITCLFSTFPGTPTPIDCAGVTFNSLVDGARVRTRLAMSTVAGSPITTTEIGNNEFQSSNIGLCEGEVVAEVSVSLMAATATQTTRVNIINQPRFLADRCTPNPADVPRMCYDTSQHPEVHGVFGDENNLVCDLDFVLSAADITAGAEGWVEFDSRLEIMEFDIIDLFFNVNPRVSPCPFAGGPFAALCADPTTRLCFQNECP